MDAQILEKPPLSGEYEEHCFGVTGLTTWVKFLDDNYLEWVGVFRGGDSSTEKVLRVPNRQLFLVIAQGNGYYVDPDTREIVASVEWDRIKDATFHEDSGHLIATNGLSLAIIDVDKPLWESEHISLGYIVLIGHRGDLIEGLIEDLPLDPVSFTMNVHTREIHLGRKHGGMMNTFNNIRSLWK